MDNQIESSWFDPLRVDEPVESQPIGEVLDKIVGNPWNRRNSSFSVETEESLLSEGRGSPSDAFLLSMILGHD